MIHYARPCQHRRAARTVQIITRWFVWCCVLATGCDPQNGGTKSVQNNNTWVDERQNVVDQLVDLGAVFGNRSDLRKWRYAQVILDERWRGGNKGLALLTRLSSLSELELDTDSVNDGCVSSLLTMRGLRSISLKRTHISDHGIAQLQALPALLRVEIDGKSYDNQTLKSLNGLPLISLTIGPKCCINDAGLVQLRGMHRLLYIRISVKDVHGVGLESIGDLPNLIALCLAGSGIDDDALSHLGAFRSLQMLDLSSTEITGQGLQYLSDDIRLHTLILNDTLVSDGSVPILTRFRGLESVSLNGTRVTDGQLFRFRQLPHLASLSVENTSVRMSGLKPLVGSRELKTARFGDGDVCIFSDTWAKLRRRDLQSKTRGRLYLWTADTAVLISQ